ELEVFKATMEYFRQAANRYQTKQLELIENEKAIELAKMEYIKVTQTRNHVNNEGPSFNNRKSGR
ncbi:23727_t:CDS:2, partial [Racocetra persica]